MIMTGHGWRVQKPTIRRTADVSMLYPLPLSPCARASQSDCFVSDDTTFLGGIVPLYGLPRARSDIRALFNCFHFTSKFFYFEPNFYRTRFLAFVECLLLFDI